MRFFDELKRRNVFRAAGVYAVVGWLIAQASTLLETALSMPAWFDTVVVSALILGFPIALVLAWAFEMTPEGMKLTATAPEGDGIAPKTARKLDYVIIGGLALVVIMIAADRFIPGRAPAAQIAADEELAGTGPAATATESANAAPVPASKDAADAKSIAVLPFADMSAEHDQEYFADGMAEEILNVLAKIDGLKVAGRTSSFSFKGKNEDLRTIGEALGVANILEGSVRKQGEKVRITAQLIRSGDGFHLWSETYDGDLSDIFDLQEKIARAIAGELKILLADGGEAPLVKKATNDEEAYRLFLQARALLAQRVGDNVPNAITLFEQAVARDPAFARAHSGLAVAYAVLDNYVPAADPEISTVAARDYADKALSLDPTLAEPHAALGLAHLRSRQYLAMRESFDAALVLDPNDLTTALWSGIGQMFVADFAAARASFDRVIALDPIWSQGYVWRAFIAVIDGELDRAEELASRGVALGHSGGDATLAEAAAARGDADAAAAFLLEAYRGRGLIAADFTLDEVGTLARGAFGGAADRKRADGLIEAYLASRRSVPESLVPYVLLRMGEPSRAFDVFARGGRGRIDQLFFLALWGPQGREARQSAEFPAFAQRFGLVDYWKKYGWPDLCRPAPARGPGAFECE